MDSDGGGSGYGSGSGDGGGDESNHYFRTILEYYSNSHGVVGFWRSDKAGRPVNGGSGNPRKVGMVEEIEGPLSICTKNALHATMDPRQWKGERWWVVRLYEPVQRKDDKIASWKREIVADLGICPFT